MFNLSILSILSIPSILLSLSLFWVQRTKENGKKKERKSQGHTSAKFQLQEFRKNFKKMMFPINPLEEALNIGFFQSPSMKTTQIFEELNETISSLSLNENVGNLNQHVVVVNQETKKFENIASTSGSHQSHTSAKFQLQEFRKNFKEMMFSINPLEETLNIGFCQSPSMKTETKKFENIASTSGSHQSHTSAKFQLQEFRKNFKKMMFSINPLEEAALLNIGFLGETHLNF